MQTTAESILRFGTRTAFGKETEPPQKAMEALARLMEGNEAYRQERRGVEPFAPVRERTAREGQHPFATVLTCSDSRVPPEHVFSAGLGALFAVRTAGNTVDTFGLGSIEYAASHLHTPLLVVMGHTCCGAVGGALSGAEEPGSLSLLLAEVRRSIGMEDDPRKAECSNVIGSAKRLGESDTLRGLCEAGRIGIALAIYDIETGEVRWMER